MKDQRPLCYRNSLVGGKYAKKKFTRWDFSFPYSSLIIEEPAPVQQDCVVRVQGTPCQIQTGEVCLNPLFLQTNPRKKRYFLLGSTNNPTSSVVWAGVMLANPSIKASWAMHPRANVLKKNQRGGITKSKEI